MTRHEGTRLAVLLGLAMFAAGVGAGYALPHGAVPGAVAAQSAAREYAVLYTDGTWRLVGADPLPTETPRATDTAIPATPTLTRTPTPAPASATPTRESAITRTPEAPSDKGCVLKVGAVAMRERAQPSTSATILDSVKPGSIVKFSAFVRGGAYLWGRTVAGYMAVLEYHADSTEWNFYGVDLSETCVDVPGWPAGLAPPAPIAALPSWGVWAGPGAPLGEMITFGQALRAAGITPAVTLYGMNDAAPILRAYGWTIVLRPWLSGQNCPEFVTPAESNARAWVDRAVDATDGVPHDWIVLSNECVAPTPEYTARWIRAAIVRAAERGERQVVPWVFPPGHPELADVPTLAAAYAHAPIAVAWGMNLYPTVEGRNLSDRGGMNEWTVWRWRLYRHQLPADVQLVVTEFARGKGSEAADFADLTLFVERSGDAFEWATAWYVAQEGGLGHWGGGNLRGKLAALARALQ